MNFVLFLFSALSADGVRFSQRS